MERNTGGTEKVRLTHDLLDLIIMVHDYRRFQISLSRFKDSHNQLFTSNWLEETKRFYTSLNDECLKRHNLSKNILSFEKVMNFKITEEMLNTERHLLPDKFTF